jgi:hypothetical protein
MTGFVVCLDEGVDDEGWTLGSDIGAGVVQPSGQAPEVRIVCPVERVLTSL